MKVLKKVLIVTGIIIVLFIVFCCIVGSNVETTSSDPEVQSTEVPEESTEVETESTETSVVEETTQFTEETIVDQVDSNEPLTEIQYGKYYYGDYVAWITRDEDLSSDVIYMYKKSGDTYKDFWTGYIYYFSNEEGWFEADDQECYECVKITFYSDHMNLDVYASEDTVELKNTEGDYTTDDSIDPELAVPIRYVYINGSQETFRYMISDDANIGKGYIFSATYNGTNGSDNYPIFISAYDSSNSTTTYIAVTMPEESLICFIGDQIQFTGTYAGYDGRYVYFNTTSIELE